MSLIVVPIGRPLSAINDSHPVVNVAPIVMNISAPLTINRLPLT